MKATLFHLEPLPGSARIRTVLNGSALTDAAGVPVDADGDGIPGGVAHLTFDTLSLTPLAGTAVIGRVLASELHVPAGGGDPADRPLPGVTITVDGMEETLRAVTDATGRFTLAPVPPGRFFVHIDGRTVVDDPGGIRYPDKAYYPLVGKAWDAEAGVTNNPAGGTGIIYLPLVDSETLRPTSITEDTSLSLSPLAIASRPEWAGVSMMVPANALFSDAGTRGGRVGIAPVDPDRLPGPLPTGMELPLVITVQTDGALNFDTPAPICFPNVPDPVLGVPLPAGSRQSLFSFNHDKGVWEYAGPMTVSADGQRVCTDPGAGILQPGWHGWWCPPDDSPPPPEPDPCVPGVSFRACIEACQVQFELCESTVKGTIIDAMKICKSLADLPEPANAAENCHVRLYRVGLELRDACRREDTACRNYCIDCYQITSPSPSTASVADLRPGFPPNAARVRLAGPPAGDPLDDQLGEIVDRILELIRPFATSGEPIPQATLDRLEELRLQADAVAGGDAAAYLKGGAIADEEALSGTAAAMGLDLDDLNLGNAPSHPVLYAATVHRPGGMLVLRGETLASGRYSLFVPRDGVIREVSLYDPESGGFAVVAPRWSPKAQYRLPRFNLAPLGSDAVDVDKDGLPDLVENVYGTNADKADTDGDGIPDGAEIEQGTDPLGGLVARTGVLATVKTPGPAIDIVTRENLAVVAQGASGVAVIDVSKITRPTLIAQVDTPGTAQRVAFAGNLVAVADGPSGLVVIDISDPPAARVLRRIQLPGVQGVAAAAGIGYAGLTSGHVVAVDLFAGTIRHGLSLTDPVVDLALDGDHLFALTRDRLHVIALRDGELEVAGSALSPFVGAQNQRLFVGGGIAYTVHLKGYNTLDVTNPAKPVLLKAGNTAQFGWRQIVPNGSGLGMAAVGPNSTDDGPHDVSLYDLGDPRVVDLAVTTFPTPGNARAVSISGGLAFVADDALGMQVVSYLPYDSKGVPPTVSVLTSFTDGAVEEGQPARVTALATDDVQVRGAELYVDGVKVATDTTFPFEFRFIAPRWAEANPSFRLRVRAVDTGGNATWADEQIVALRRDNTPPRIAAYAPVGGARTLTRIQAYFSEPMSSGTLGVDTLRVFSAGADGVLDTPDDAQVQGGSVSYRAEPSSAEWTAPTPLADGSYRAVVSSAVTDIPGNPMGADYHWRFQVRDAVFWSNRGGGTWNDPFNWSTGSVPTSEEHVVIDVSPGDAVVTHSSGTLTARSLVLHGRMNLNGAFANVGVLQVAEEIRIGGVLALSGGIVRGGTIRQMAGGGLSFAQNTGITLDGVTVVGDLDLTRSSVRVLIRNGLNLEGTVRLDNGGAIGFAGVQTFNTGSIQFGGNTGFLSVEGNSTLTLGPDMVVRGKSGTIGQNIFIGGNNKLINQGRISADVPGGTIVLRTTQFENPGAVSLQNGGSLTLNGATWSNSGRIDADGGVLTLAGAWSNTGTIRSDGAAVNFDTPFTLETLGTFQRTGGAVKLRGAFAVVSILDLNGGTLALDDTTGPWTLEGGTIRNGTVTQEGGGQLIFSSNPGNRLDAVKVVGDLDLTRNAGRVLIRNGLTLEGTVRLDNGGVIGFSGVQTFNTGGIVFEGNTGILSVEGNSTLTLGPDMVVRGKSGTIGQAVFAGGTNKIINQGRISADVAGGTLTLRPTQFENTGILEEKNGGKLVRP